MTQAAPTQQAAPAQARASPTANPGVAASAQQPAQTAPTQSTPAQTGAEQAGAVETAQNLMPKGEAGPMFDNPGVIVAGQKAQVVDTNFHGNYKTKEDFIQAFENQKKFISDKNATLTDDMIVEEAIKRGKLEQVPDSWEKYENIPAVMERNGFQYEPKMAQAILEGLREDGVGSKMAQKILNRLLPIHYQQIAEYGPQVDKQMEVAKLEREFGPEHQAIYQSTMKEAAANVHPNVLHKPIWATAEGVKFMKSYLDMKRGSQPLQANTVVGGANTLAELKAEYAKVQADPDYGRITSPKYKQLQEKTFNLARAITRLEKK